VQFQENRPFLAEGTELFGKGGLFYREELEWNLITESYPPGSPEDSVIEIRSRLNCKCSKISGRTQKG